MTIKNPNSNQTPPLCKCGCKNHVKWNRKAGKWRCYLRGHNSGKTKRISINEKPPLCACGCGGFVAIKCHSSNRKCNKYIIGHSNRDEKVKLKISKALKGRIFSQETKQKISLALIGRKLSEEHRRKIGLIVKNRTVSQKTREKMSKSQFGRKHSEETKQKIGRANSGSNNGMKSATTRKKVSDYQKRLWQNPKYKRIHLKKLFEWFHHQMTRPEIALLKILFHLFPHEYKYVGNGKKWIGGKNPDFININGQKKIIELFGNYWHSEKWTGKKKKEHKKERCAHFWNYGYNCLVVWEHELKDIKKLKNKLCEFHNE
jgi:hypothetical protein